ncbi:MAG TPA: hypothetical protein VF635_18155, partial [Propionibacteriaceae bacterium]
MRVVKAIAEALNISAGTLLEQAGLIKESSGSDNEATEAAIHADRRLTEPQKWALMTVCRS